MTKFSNKFKRPCFWPILGLFSQFLAQKKFKIFLENLALSCTTSYGFLVPCQNLEKVNDTIQRKCPDRWKDRQNLFHRTLPVTVGGQKRLVFTQNQTSFCAWKRFQRQLQELSYNGQLYLQCSCGNSTIFTGKINFLFCRHVFTLF